MNNYERIKSMTVDEMAEEFFIYTTCSACAAFEICENHNESKHKCINLHKQWLLSEVEDANI